MLYNTLEGLTCLWDLEEGGIKAKCESYQRNKHEEGVQEPGELSYVLILFVLGALRVYMRDMKLLVLILSPGQHGQCLFTRQARHTQPQAARGASPYTPRIPPLLVNENLSYQAAEASSGCVVNTCVYIHRWTNSHLIVQARALT